MVKKNACIFISGKGSNLKNLIDRSRDYNFPISIKLVVSDKKKALGIFHAKKNSIPILLINTKSRNYENTLLMSLKKYKISLICLAGYMKILSKKLIDHYPNKIINIHPSLLPKYKGLNTHQRVLENNETKTGCTVHYVNQEMDGGKIILQREVEISAEDTQTSVSKKVLKEEHIIYPKAIKMVLTK